MEEGKEEEVLKSRMLTMAGLFDICNSPHLEVVQFFHLILLFLGIITCRKLHSSHTLLLQLQLMIILVLFIIECQ